MTRRPRLRTLLLLVNVVILCLPLAGIGVLRIYESALIRQTESELIAQGAFIAAAYRAAFSRVVARSEVISSALSDYGLPLTFERMPSDEAVERWKPRPPLLDLATAMIRPPQPDTFLSVTPVDPLALAVGRELTPLLRDAQVVTLAGIRVVDYRGLIVASTGETAGMSMLNSEEVIRALNGEPVSLLRKRLSDQPPPPLASISRGSRLRVFVATPIIQEGRILGAVILSRTPSTISRALYGKRYLLLELALVLLAVVLLITVFTSLTISRPVQALIHQAERAVHGERGAVTPLSRPVTQEIAQLSGAFAVLTQTLERRADYIRSFAAHVSHEFKTPLTAIQGAVELLQEHAESMSREEREHFLSNLHKDAARLGRLVQRLLDLARADMMVTGTGAVDAAALVNQIVTRYRDQGMHITVTRTSALPRVAIAQETLDAILSNLIDNARQHGGDGVHVSLHLDTCRHPPVQLVMTVVDDGPGISPANATRIFEPFFTTARRRGGTGMGLVIVKSLLAAHQGHIELAGSSTGAAFRVFLPALR